MDTTAFFSLVMPRHDTFVLCIARGDRLHNRNYATIEEAAEAAATLDRGDATVYFAVGKFADNEDIHPDTGRPIARRKQHMATVFKTLCADVDVGRDKPYATQAEAIRAVGTACINLGLPLPTVVLSGTGVHVYWPLQEVIPAHQWEAMSIALRNAMQSEGVVLDNSKVHDRSMVLRPPGTHHKKDPDHWKPVRVAKATEPTPALVLARALAPFKGLPVPPVRRERRKSAVAAALLGHGDFPPLQVDDLRKCPQLRAIIASGGTEDAAGAAVAEPLWRLTLGMAKFCETPEVAVEKLAGGHPEYDAAVNIQKMEAWQGSGPPTCQAFENLCSVGCEDCPHKGKITSPGQLHSGVDTVQAAMPAAVPAGVDLGGGYHQPVPETTQSLAIDGYAYKGNWLIRKPLTPEDDEVYVCPYQIFVAGVVTDADEDKSEARLAVNLPLEGWKMVNVPLATISKGGAELGAELANKHVYLQGETGALRRYLMTYLSELQKQRAVEKAVSHFGWQSDGSFLGPTGLVGGTAASNPHYEGAISQYQRHIQPKGSLEAWSAATKLFAEPSLKHHGLVFLMMAGSPLFAGAGPASMLVNSYSRDSGSGKTLVGVFGCSIWGDPRHLIRTVNDTENSLYKHFGILHSLGAFIDEITTMSEETLRNLVFTIPEGKERARVKQSADGFREAVTWRMPVFSSSNRDLHDALNTRYSSEAERLRVLQFNFDRVALFEDNAKVGYTFYKHLHNNYGTAGPALAQAIIARGGPERIFESAYERFDTKYGFQFLGPERFYQAAFVVADAIGEIGEAEGLFKFDHRDAVARGLQVVEQLRTRSEEETFGGVDIVSQYCTEKAHEFVNHRVRCDAAGNVRPMTDAPQHRSAVGRTEIEWDASGQLDHAILYLNAPLFKKWCRKNGAEYRAVVSDLMAAHVQVSEGRKKSLYAGVEGFGAVGQVSCLRINLNTHPQLLDAITSVAPQADGKPRLRVV